LITEYNFADLPEFVTEYELTYAPGNYYIRKPTDSTTLNGFEDFLIAFNLKDPNKNIWLNM
jgi:hypothetical protein